MIGKPYGPLGEVMDEIARKRNVRGPYRVGEFVRSRTGGGPRGNTWSDYFYAKSAPTPDTMRRFRDAFECDEEEVQALAYTRTFLGDREE